jgi:hypothetical protein
VVVFTVTFSVAPVPTNVPPHVPLYHLQVEPDPKAPPTTLKVTVPGVHSEVAVALAAVGAVEGEFIVTDVVGVTAGHPPPADKV